MAARTTRFTNDAAVRIFLGAQGLAAGRPIGRVDSRHFSKLISRLRLLQIDSVNVVARAHYMPAFARLGNYDRDALDRWIYDGRNMFEYWCHEQSYAPMSFYAMMRPRMEALVDHPWKRIQELRRDGPDYIQAVLDEGAEPWPDSQPSPQRSGGKDRALVGVWKGEDRPGVAVRHRPDHGESPDQFRALLRHARARPAPRSLGRSRPDAGRGRSSAHPRICRSARNRDGCGSG